MEKEHHRYDRGLLLPECNSTASSFDSLFGHNWQTEAAAEWGVPVVDDLDEYYSLCYQSLVNTGVGTSEMDFLVMDPAVLQNICEQSDTKGFREGYWYPYCRAYGLGSDIYYSYSSHYWWIGSRGDCWYFNMQHSIFYQ